MVRRSRNSCARRYLLTRVQIPGDGSCLFWCLMHALGMGVPSTDVMRSQIADIIGRDFDEYRCKLQATHGKQFETVGCYVKFITNRNTWGSVVELQAFAVHFKIAVCFWNSPGKLLDTFGEKEGCSVHVCHIVHEYLGEKDGKYVYEVPSAGKEGNHFTFFKEAVNGAVYGSQYGEKSKGTCSCSPERLACMQEYAKCNDIALSAETSGDEKKRGSTSSGGKGKKGGKEKKNKVLFKPGRFCAIECEGNTAREVEAVYDYMIYRVFGQTAGIQAYRPYADYCENGHFIVRDRVDEILKRRGLKVLNPEEQKKLHFHGVTMQNGKIISRVMYRSKSVSVLTPSSLFDAAEQHDYLIYKLFGPKGRRIMNFEYSYFCEAGTFMFIPELVALLVNKLMYKPSSAEENLLQAAGLYSLEVGSMNEGSKVKTYKKEVDVISSVVDCSCNVSPDDNGKWVVKFQPGRQVPLEYAVDTEEEGQALYHYMVFRVFGRKPPFGLPLSYDQWIEGKAFEIRAQVDADLLVLGYKLLKPDEGQEFHWKGLSVGKGSYTMCVMIKYRRLYAWKPKNIVDAMEQRDYFWFRIFGKECTKKTNFALAYFCKNNQFVAIPELDNVLKGAGFVDEDFAQNFGLECKDGEEAVEGVKHVYKKEGGETWYVKVSFEGKLFQVYSRVSVLAAIEARDYLWYRYYGSDCTMSTHFKYEHFCVNGTLKANVMLDNHFDKHDIGIPTSSTFIGVSLKRGKWVCRVAVFGKRLSLGPFKDEEEAARAHDYVLFRMYGRLCIVPVNFTFHTFLKGNEWKRDVSLDLELEKHGMLLEPIMGDARIGYYGVTKSGKDAWLLSVTLMGVDIQKLTNSAEVAARERDYLVYRVLGQFANRCMNFHYDLFCQGEGLRTIEHLDALLRSNKVNRIIEHNDTRRIPYICGEHVLGYSGEVDVKFWVNKMEVLVAQVSSVRCAIEISDYCLYRVYGPKPKDAPTFPLKLYMSEGKFIIKTEVDDALIKCGVNLFSLDELSNGDVSVSSLGVRRVFSMFRSHFLCPANNLLYLKDFYTEHEAALMRDYAIKRIYGNTHNQLLNYQDKFILGSHGYLESFDVDRDHCLVRNQVFVACRDKVLTILPNYSELERAAEMGVVSFQGRIWSSFRMANRLIVLYNFPTLKEATDVTRYARIKLRGSIVDILRSGGKVKMKEGKFVEDDEMEKKLALYNYVFIRPYYADMYKTAPKYIQDFIHNVCDGPSYACICCDQMFSKQQMRLPRLHFYEHLVIKFTNRIFRKDTSPLICIGCHTSASKGDVPLYSLLNDFAFNEVPKQLSQLTFLEAILCSPRVVFMTLLSSHGTSCRRLKGGVTYVPLNIDTVVRTLPRMPNEAFTIICHFKRRLADKHDVWAESISPEKVHTALQYLCKNSRMFQRLNISYDSTRVCFEFPGSTVIEGGREHNTSSSLNVCGEVLNGSLDSDVDMGENEACVINGKECTRLHENGGGIEGQHNPSMDDCTKDQKCQPKVREGEVQNPGDVEEDDGNEDEEHNHGTNATFVQNSNYLHSDANMGMAPAENNAVISILNDDVYEESTNITVHGGEQRIYANRATAKQIDKWELRNKDMRVARKNELIAMKKHRQAIYQTMNVIATRVRHEKLGSIQKLSASHLLDETFRESLLKDFTLYNEFQGVTGSHDWYSKLKKDIFACIRQLGMPTFFVTLSMADLKWDELAVILSKVMGKPISYVEAQEMAKKDRIKLIEMNTVPVTRYYVQRKREILKVLRHEECHILGGAQDFFGVDEFQFRGAPHTHLLIWARDAVDVITASKNDIVLYIDKHISTDILKVPEEIKKHQTHKCTFTCSKTKKMQNQCRFDYPKFPSNETHLLQPLSQKEVSTILARQLKEKYSDMKKYLRETPPQDLKPYEELLEAFDMNEEEYHNMIRFHLTQTTVLYKRQSKDTWTNTFNAELIQLWNANIDVQFCLHPFAIAVYISNYISKEAKGMSALMKEIVRQAPEDVSNIKSMLHRVGAAMIGAQEMCMQEAIYHILGMSLRSSSREVKFIHTGPPEKRIVTLKTKEQLESLARDSRDILAENALISQYEGRPVEMEHVCLADYAAWFTKKNSTDTEEEELLDENVHEFEDIEEDEVKECPKEMNAKCSTAISARKRQRIIRYVNYDEVGNPSDYMREKVLLFVPFRKEEYVQLHAAVLFKTHEQFIRERAKEFDPNNLNYAALIRDYEDLVKQQMDSEFNTNDEQGPRTGVEGVDLVHEYANARRGVSSNLARGAIRLENDEYTILMDLLNKEQKGIVDHVMKHVTTDGCSPLHLFITGGAGVGKSVVVNALYESLMIVLSERGLGVALPKVLKLAFQGTAAYNIGGNTVNSGLKIPMFAGPYPAPLSGNALNILRSELQYVQFIIIDEVSQVSHKLFSWINARLQQVRGNTELFGGFHVILVGDLFQLAPVTGSWIFQAPGGCFGSLIDSLFSGFQLAELKEIMRQDNDSAFAQALNRLREGKHTKKDINLFESCTRNPEPIPTGREKYKVLFFENKDCYRWNRRMFRNADTEKHVIHGFRPREKSGEETDTSASSGDDESTEEERILRERRKRNALQAELPAWKKRRRAFNIQDNRGGLTRKLFLFEGGHVQTCVNIDVRDGLANGTNGIVRHFSKDENDNVDVVWVEFERPEIGEDYRRKNAWSYIKYPEVNTAWTPIYRHKQEYEVTGLVQKLSYINFPLRMASALTIHRSQGITLDGGIIDFAGCRNEHMYYVAFSRFRDISKIHVKNFDPKQMRVSDKVLSVMNSKRKNCVLQLNHLPVHLRPDHCTASLLYQNVRGLERCMRYFEQSHRLEKVDILCFSESWHTMDREPPLSKLGFYFHCGAAHPLRQHKIHGVIMYSRTFLSNITTLSTPMYQMVSANTQLNSGVALHIILAYRSPSDKYNSVHFEQFVKDIQHLCASSNEPAKMILGDFNVETNDHLSVFEDRLHELGFVQKITKHTTKHKSSVDHIWCTRKGPSFDIDYHWNHLSDHLPLVAYGQ